MLQRLFLFKQYSRFLWCYFDLYACKWSWTEKWKAVYSYLVSFCYDKIEMTFDGIGMNDVILILK